MFTSEKYWNVFQEKQGTTTAELRVSIIVKEMAYHQSSISEGWIANFIDRVKKEVPRTNTYSAEFSFKATPRNLHSLEVWKMKANGDFNYKMFTVTKIQEWKSLNANQ